MTMVEIKSIFLGSMLRREDSRHAVILSDYTKHMAAGDQLPPVLLFGTPEHNGDI